MVTRVREFSHSKRIESIASEPPSSLVNELEELTQLSEGERRWMADEISEVATIDFREQGRRVLEDLLPSTGDPVQWWGVIK